MPPKFKERSKARDYDKESRKSRLITTSRKKHPPPPESESDENVSDQSDTELEEQLEMPVKDDSRRVHLRSGRTRPRKDKETAQQTAPHATKESEVKEETLSSAPHMIMIAAVYHMRVAPITFPTTSTYVPSFYMFYFALDAAHNCVVNNSYLRNLSPHYITVASSLYYGYLGFLQILRAKDVAGIITRDESQVLKKFTKEYPLESLPVMSPLIPFFQNLGAVKLADPMYSWICPTIPRKLGTDSNVDGIFAANDSIMLPNVPALLRFLREIGEAVDVAAITEGTGIAPASRVSGNTNFFGIDLSPNHHNLVDFQRLAYSAGMLQPREIPQSVDVRTLRRVQRWALPQVTSATDLSTVGGFLQTNDNIEWFKNLVNIATEECKFFTGSTNMSAIPPTAGLASLFETSYTNVGRPTAVDDIYALSSPGFHSQLWDFRGTTTRGESSNEELQFGGMTQFLVTGVSHLTPNNHIRPVFTTSGPYFDLGLGGRQAPQYETDLTRTPRLSFEQLIREKLYVSTGGQNPST